ncbi:MAG: glycosyltransferase family 39 protein [Deltaproteobacteria bacterium]|nr:glycosyltransferase family 39 protein [Deltaproteobacteria bacterium]
MKKHLDNAAALALLAGVLFLAARCGYGAFTTNIYIPDETDIIQPALGGSPYPLSKYPPFPFMVYGAVLGLFPDAYPLLVARALNFGLLLVNLGLFFLLCRRFLDKKWSLFALFAFLGMPVVYYSGIIVKTEGLLLLELLVLMLCLERIHRLGDKPWVHACCGVVCALAVTTKYMVFLPMLYAGFTLHAYRHASQLKNKAVNWAYFCLGFLPVLFMTWPNFQNYLINWRDYTASDLYRFRQLFLGCPVSLESGRCLPFREIQLRPVDHDALFLGTGHVLDVCRFAGIHSENETVFPGFSNMHGDLLSICGEYDHDAGAKHVYTVRADCRLDVFRFYRAFH